MNDGNSIQHAIGTLESELETIELRAQKIRQAIAVLRELLPTTQQPVVDKPPVNTKPMTRLKGITMVKAAALILSEAKHPMHVSEIMERMLDGGFKPGTPENFRLSLVGSLDRGAKSDDPRGWFYKPEPATYGLREWASHNGGDLRAD
jgi:hypothetical protein